MFDQLVGLVADDSVLLSSVLLRAKVFASDLPGRKFRAWLTSETNGYACKREELPAYRRLRTHLTGLFFGIDGSRMKNVILPTHHFPPDIAEHYDFHFVYEGVGVIEELAAERSGVLRLKLADAEEQFYKMHPGIGFDGAQLVEIQQHCGVALLGGILKAVRSRLLDFLLELKDRHPGLAGNRERPGSLPEAEVADALNRTIYQGCTFSGVDMSDKSVTIGSVNAGRDVVIAGRIRGSFNQVSASPANAELKKLLEDLAGAVVELAAKLSLEKAEEVAKDYEVLATEAVKPEPRRKWYELSGEGLVQAAKSVGEAGKSVVGLVASILGLLK